MSAIFLVSGLDAGVRFWVNLGYRAYYWVWPAQELASDSVPLVMLTGLFGFSPNKCFGFRYFEFDPGKMNRPVFIPDLPPTGSNLVRAKVVLAYLKGGNVDVDGVEYEYPGVYKDWGVDMPVDMIGHSQGALCGDALIQMAEPGAVRNYVRLTGISRDMKVVLAANKILDGVDEAQFLGLARSLGWPACFVYAAWMMGVINRFIPATKIIVDMHLPPNSTPLSVARGISVGLDYPTSMDELKARKVRTLNVVASTGDLSWSERLLMSHPMFWTFIAIESTILKRVDVSFHDGLVDVEEQKYDGAIQASTVRTAALISEPGSVVELLVASNHLAVLPGVSRRFVKGFRGLTEVALVWLNILGHTK
jgi:hypothetical protein